MSPELIDEAILAHCEPHFLKVLRVMYEAAKALGVSTDRKAHLIIADRIKALVKAERLESAGNLDAWGYSEIRLRAKKASKKASKATAETSRLRETTEQGT
jgi:hypothetical protein